MIMRKLFFERAKENRGEVPTTFVYDKIPDEVKRQLVLIWNPDQQLQLSHNQVEAIVKQLRESLAMFKLATTSSNYS